MAAAHASVLALQTGVPRVHGRTRQLPSWNVLADFVSHCHRVMSDDDLKRELGGKSLKALKAELFTEPKLGPAPVRGYRPSAHIINELAVPANNRKAA